MNPLIECLGWTLVHFLWQGAAIAILLAMSLWLLRKKAASHRYLAGCAALFLMAVAPMVTARIVAQSLDATPVSIEAKAFPDTSTQELIPRAGVKKVVVSKPAPRTESFSEKFESALPWLVVAWALGVGLLSCRLIGGWLRIKRLQQTAGEPVAESWYHKLEELAARLEIKRPLLLVQSALIEVPTVIGWLKPVILLPAGCLAGLTPQQLESVLAHELAHIRRHDYLVNLLQSVVETLLFYHPAVWWVSGRIREERENCCDDMAVRICGDPIAYARALASLEELRGAPAQLALAANGGSLLQRIQRLLGKSSARSSVPAWPLAGIVAVLMVLVMATGLHGGSTTADEVLGPDKFITTTGIFHYTNAETEVELTIQTNGMWLAATNGSNHVTTKAGSTNWKPDRGSFIYLDNELRAWACDGQRGLWLVTADGSRSSSTPLDSLRERPPGVAMKRLPESIAKQLPSEEKSASHHRFSFLFEQGRMLYEAGKLEEAEAKLSAACKEKAADEKSKLYLEAVRQKLRADEVHYAELVQQGKLLYEEGKLDEAEAKLVQVYKDDPANAAAYQYLQMIHQQKMRNAGKPVPETDAISPLAESESRWPVRAKTNHISKGRQQILDKLSKIQVPSAEYNGVPLTYVLNEINMMAKKGDPEQRGINIFIDKDGAAVTSWLAQESLKSEPVDMGTVKINLTPALHNVTLGKLISAVAKAADKPIQYSILDYAIVFSPRGPERNLLPTRKYHVEWRRFEGVLRRDGFLSANVIFPTNSGGVTSRIWPTEELQLSVRQFLKSSGVQVEESSAPKTIKAAFYNHRAGILLVRATTEELDKIGDALAKALPPLPPEINIKAKFVEVGGSGRAAKLAKLYKSFGIEFTTNEPSTSLKLKIPEHKALPELTNSQYIKGITNSLRAMSCARLSEEQLKSFMKALKEQTGADILSTPEVTTEHERQAELMVGSSISVVVPDKLGDSKAAKTNAPRIEQLFLGPVLDLLPAASADGKSVDLEMIASLTEFLGYTKPGNEPQLKKYEFATKLNLLDGETLLLGGIEEDKGLSSRQKRSNAKNGKDVLVLVTATLINPDGTRFNKEGSAMVKPKGLEVQPVGGIR